tara:strand:- start:143 stop:484 length:342 start_codon:yes stop_codon:yes gene_type:complete
MFSWINQSRFVYILSNLLVLPANVIPFFDFISNISFIVAFVLFINTSSLQTLALCILFIIKNNSNYRFHILLKRKGEELSKSDYECVFLYAWCTILRYSLIGLAANQIYFIFK